MTKLKYKAVEEDIRSTIGTLDIGSRLPSERELALSYQCSFLTIRKALKALVDDGTIVRKVGNGSYVAPKSPNQPKSTNAQSRSNRLGVLIYHPSNAYSQKVLQMLSVVAADKKIELRSAWVRGFNEESLKQASNLVDEGCSGIVLPWFPLSIGWELSNFIPKCPVPVSIPLLIPGLEKNYFGNPDTFGIDLLTTVESLYGYFQHLGSHQVALLGPATPNDPVLQKMLSAYTCLVQERNLANICGLIGPGANAMDQLAQRWKAYRGDLAIISYDDEYSLRFLTAMHKLGLSAPDDFKIIGHNNSEASHFSDPPLSTISRDFYHVAANLLDKAVSLAQKTPYESSTTIVANVLVRKTCGGHGRITPAIRKAFPYLRFIEEDAASTEPARVGEAGGVGAALPV